MLILLNTDGLVVGTLPYEAAAHVVLVSQYDADSDRDLMFEYEATQGEDHIYRLIET